MKQHTRNLLVLMSVVALLVSTAKPISAAGGTWSLTGSLHTARDGHTASLLSDGTVIVAGGENNNTAINSSEIYNPATGAWTASGNLNVARANAQAVMLQDGRVLVAGGCISNCQGSTTASAETYSSGAWTSTGSMITARTYFGAVVLSSGSVLVAGGCTALNANGCSAVTNKAEIFNPSTGTWTSTGSMSVARGALTATLLSNGNVLVAGGQTAAGDALSSCELYNPTTGKWTLTGRMNAARDEHTAVLLTTGNVLAVGGENVSGVSNVKTELYNPSTGKWTLTGNLNTGRQEHTSTPLANGSVLVSGGTKVTSTTSTVLSSAEIYDPSTGVWTKTGSLNNARTGHTATLLNSGEVLAASGSGSNNDLRSAELYMP